MLPSEIENAIADLADASSNLGIAHQASEAEWSAKEDLEHAAGMRLRAAIFKYGDQRYEEGIEAGRELEQTKMSGN